MNAMERVAQPPENDDCPPFQISSLEVSFAVPVWITLEDQQELHRILDRIIGAPHNQLKDGVHWLAGFGSKPHYSRADSMFLGKAPEPGAPETGGPTFDDEVFFMESAARGFLNDDERQIALNRREAKEGAK